MKRKPDPKNLEPRKFSDGETVEIIRPSPLWSGCVGSVVGFKDGLHRVRIEAKPDGSTMPFFRWRLLDPSGSHAQGPFQPPELNPDNSIFDIATTHLASNP